MRDQHSRDAARAQEIGHGASGAGAQAGVKRRERLVEKHEPRPPRQRPRQRDALLLATGDLVGLAGQHVLLEANHLEELRDLLVATGRVFRQSKANILRDRQVRKQRTVLRDNADVPQMGGHERDGRRQACLAELDGAGIGCVEAGDHAQQRRLARARGADNGEAAAGFDPQGHRVERLHAPVALRHHVQMEDAAQDPALRLVCACSRPVRGSERIIIRRA